MSLANIHSKVRAKVSQHAFVPLAFLPVVEFIHKNQRMKGVLSDRLYHCCLDIVMKPLKTAAEIGVMLSDPLGNNRYSFTPLASCIVDTPEACLIACVRGKTSPLTLADYTEFGDAFRHQARTKAITLNQIESINVDPNDLIAFFDACGEYRLNGVDLPFWRDWPLSDPVRFLTPEVLHTFFRFSYDHDLSWCVRAVGPAEIDFRFSILHPITSHRHFPTGVTKLKQVTGRTQRDLQRYLVAVIAGAVPAGMVRAIRSLVDFRYRAQSPVIDDDQCHKIVAALESFHTHKQSIIDAGARCGEKGRVLEHWQIPKLELMQGVAPSIPLVGPPIQWTADATERAHIDVVKKPATATNNVDFESQICRHLDRHEKCRKFSLALHIRENEIDKRQAQSVDSDADSELATEDHPQYEAVDSPSDEPSSLDAWVPGVAPRSVHDYFASAAKPSTVSPPRSFIYGPVAFHLRLDPVIGSISISDVAEKFDLPDLRAALVHFFYRKHDRPLTVGGQRYHRADEPLPFQRLQVWNKVRLQQRSYHDSSVLLPAQTLNASPPAARWPKGRYDAAFVNIDDDMVWPHSGIEGTVSLLQSAQATQICIIYILGHNVCEMRLIFRPIPPRGLKGAWWSTRYLVYAVRFDIRNGFEDATGMYVMNRATRACGTAMGDIIPLSQFRALAPLVPKFGDKANLRLTAETSSYYSHSFYLNQYFDKELYYALCS